MYVQLITFRLDGISEADFAALCDQIAPEYPSIDGLVSKIFVRDPDDRRAYGGVYVWRTREAAEVYLREGLASMLAERPEFVDLESRFLDVVPGPTAIAGGPFAAALRTVTA